MTEPTNHPKPGSPLSDLIFGRHPVIDAIHAGRTFDKIYFQQGLTGEFEKEVRGLCKQYDIPLAVVPREKFRKLLGKELNHQGIVGGLSAIEYQTIQDVLPHIFEQGHTPLLVMLDGVTDVRNMGAIARTAEVMGAHALIVGKKNAAPVNGEAMKASAGALNILPVCRENSLSATIETLQLSGVQVYAADVEGHAELHELDFAGPTCILMGAEGEGVSQGLLRKCQKRFKIAQFGQTESLNVSVAAGMALYEASKQRTVNTSV